MMTEGNFCRAVSFCGVTKHTSAQFCAKRTRIAFLSYVKNNLRYVRRLYIIFDAQLLTELFNLRKICFSLADFLKTHINCHGNQLKRHRIEFFQACHCVKQSERILSARKSDGNGVPRRNHIIIVASAPCKAQKAFKSFHRNSPDFCIFNI